VVGRVVGGSSGGGIINVLIIYIRILECYIDRTGECRVIVSYYHHFFLWYYHTVVDGGIGQSIIDGGGC